MQDKRQHVRKPVHLPVELTIERTQARSPGLCTDISIGGMFVETEAACVFGDKVSVCLNQVVLAAVVRWCARGGLGLQFDLMGARETHLIASIISANR